MKRLLATLCLTLTATAAFAFDATRRERVAVLRPAHEPAIAMADALRRELRQRGIDAFDAEATYEDVMEDAGPVADYYVEIVDAVPASYDSAAIGVAGRHADVSVGVVTSRVSAEVRVYDAVTMEVLASESLTRKRRSVMPTSVGVGGGIFYAVIGLPFERAQIRSIAKAAAREAATVVIEAIRAE